MAPVRRRITSTRSEIVGAFLVGCVAHAAAQSSLPHEIICEGVYRSHIQGIASDRKSAIFWSFTRDLVKTDLTGKVLKSIKVQTHHGDLTHVDGKLYVAWSSFFNRPGADSRVYVYDADDLTPLAAKEIPEVTFGAGAMDYHDGRFFVAGGLPDDINENYVYEYARDLTFVKRHVIASGHTHKGIQALGHWRGHWWLGCYGGDLIKTDDNFAPVGKYRTNWPYGIVGWDEGTYLLGVHFGKRGACRGKAVRARLDADRGLVRTKP